MARDNFTKKNVDTVAKRAGYKCSNPACRQITIGPSEQDNTGHDHIGVAAHISEAAPGGPRLLDRSRINSLHDSGKQLYIELHANNKNMHGVRQRMYADRPKPYYHQ